jgi:hypothetical protein
MAFLEKFLSPLGGQRLSFRAVDVPGTHLEELVSTVAVTITSNLVNLKKTAV